MTNWETTAPAQAITPAATLLLLRERAAEVEVLMMRRGQALRFMGGMWVFPGGRVDPSDCTPAAAALVPADVEPAQGRLCAIDGEPLPGSLALGLRVAACRETFEEAGLLLVRRRDGRPVAPGDLRPLHAERERVTRTPGGFTDLLAAAGLLLDVGQLVYWSHWITPSHEPRRFDTRFFARSMPPGQWASVDRRESTDLAWLTPRDACHAAERGEMQLAPPTLLTLEDLDEAHTHHGGVTAMLAAERGRATPPVMPRIRVESSTMHVLLPWDPAYAQAQGEGSTAPAGYPPHLTRRRSSLVIPREALSR